MIKCIISDLGNVIVKNHPMWMCKGLAKYSCLTARQIYERYIGSEDFHKTFSLGNTSNKEFYKNSLKKTKAKNLPQKRFERIYAGIFTNNISYQKLLRKLKRNYKLILLSNTNTIHFNYKLKRLPVLNLFDSFVLSYRISSVKPSLKIYKAALKESGFKAKECVYIDDIKAYADAAKKIGVHGLHYTTTAKLKKDIRRLGVKL